jgi:hypothetical protein
MKSTCSKKMILKALKGQKTIIITVYLGRFIGRIKGGDKILIYTV